MLLLEKANIRIMETVASRLGLPMEKVRIVLVYVISVLRPCCNK